MKKIKVVLMLFLMVGILASCGDRQQEEIKEEVKKDTKEEVSLVPTDIVIEDVITALENRWDISMSTEDAPELEKYDNHNKCVEAELEILEEYRNKEFEDEEFGEIIQKYIMALDKQKEAYQYKDDKDKYHEAWQQGYNARVEYLKQINENYDLAHRFTDSKYIKEFESITGVYTQIPIEKITNTDWVGIWGTVIGDISFGFHIDSIDEETKTCEVYVYANEEDGIDSAPVKGTILDNNRLYFAFEDSAHVGDDSYTVKFIVEKDETVEEEYKLTIDWSNMNETTDDNVYNFVYAMDNNALKTIGLFREQ